VPLFNHVGVLVADLSRAKAFYQEVLGFTPWFESAAGDESTTRLLSLPGPLDAVMSYLVLGDLTVELIHFGSPDATVVPRRRALDELGLTHLSIAVDDVATTAARAVELGGEVLEETDLGIAVMIRDPDGQVIELLDIGYRDHLPPRPIST
jgi:lactoylglutathione lyase